MEAINSPPPSSSSLAALPSSPPSSSSPAGAPSQPSLSSSSSSTYIVLVPKDQVFRVPPPQNATLAETYKKKHSEKKPWFHEGRRRCLMGIIISFASLFVAAVGLYLAVGPSLPVFFVESFHSRSSRRSDLPMRYVVGVRVRNPSARMGISYERGGTGVLEDANGDKAVGSVLGFYQVPGDSRTVFINFSGQTMHGLSFSLVLKLRIKMRVGGVVTRPVQVSIFCEFHVSSHENSKALLRRCRSVLEA